MGHFYDKLGSPQYHIDGRDSTLRDARKYGWVPSVTEIMQVVDKAALTNWLVKQGIMAALTGTRLDGESDDAYIARILADSKRQAIDAANEGTRIHDACETMVKCGTCHPDYTRHADAAVAELRRLFPEVNDWVAEKSFAHSLGFGGKVDLHSPSTGIIVDYKTKDGDFSDGKKLAWDQNIQLAAYQVGLLLCQRQEGAGSEPTTWTGHVQCANIFVSRTHPGCVASHVWSAEEIAHGWSVFEAALALWKRIKKYDGAFK